jgi:lipoprotein signal peptidase
MAYCKKKTLIYQKLSIVLEKKKLNTKYWMLPAIIVADVITKSGSHVPFTDHYRSITLLHMTTSIALLSLLVWMRPQTMFWASVAITGAFLNYFDSLDGLVINPFAIISNTISIAFNIADIAIAVGAIGIVISAAKTTKSDTIQV